MKDFTTTSFGLIIAYLLPGMVFLFSLSAWSDNVRKVFGSLFSSQVDAGLIVSLGGCAMVVGLVLNVFRWLIFEKALCRKYSVSATVFSKTSGVQQLQSFLMIIEETFRYHQFYGSMAVLGPFLYLTWLRYFETVLIDDPVFLLLTFTFMLAEFFLIWASYEKACGAAKAAWIASAYKFKHMRTWVHALQLIVLVLYVLAFGVHFGGFTGRYALLAVSVAFTFGGIAVAANAIAAQRRYSERANNLAGV